MRTAVERAAAFYRAGKTAKAPPKDLSGRARLIWREIVSAKPVDWFDGGSLGLLADHCRTGARLEECWRRLDRYPVGSSEARLVMIELRTLRANYTTSSRLLRLTVSYGIERQAVKAGERAPDAHGDELIGGEAGKRFRVVA